MKTPERNRLVRMLVEALEIIKTGTEEEIYEALHHLQRNVPPYQRNLYRGKGP